VITWSHGISRRRTARGGFGRHDRGGGLLLRRPGPPAGRVGPSLAGLPRRIRPLSDDFGGTRLDPRKWQAYNAPDAATHPGTNAGTHVADGRLVLVGGLYKGQDQSAGVISRMAQTYGRWEARFRAAPGAGYSATAFLWPTHLGAPEWSEIDFAEILSGDRRSGGLFIHHGKDDRQVQRTTRADFTKWHTVAVDWLPDHVTFWMDGRRTWTYRGAFIPKRSDMHLYLRNERKNGFHRTTSTPQKVAMEVDWIRVYRAPNATR
jgi:Glycosyl hydrolases family 16